MDESKAGISLLTDRLLYIDSPQLEYQSLLNAKDFISATSIIEALLPAEGSNLGHRLAWILCQLELEQVPVLALCSPLEEVSPKLQEKLQAGALPGKLLAFATGVYLRTSTTLINQQKLRLAVPVLESAFNLANQLGIAKAEKEQVRELLVSTIREEITKAETRRDSATYIKSLEDSAIKYEQTVIKEDSDSSARTDVSEANIEVPTDVEQTKKVKGKAGKSFSAKSLLQDFDKNNADVPDGSGRVRILKTKEFDGVTDKKTKGMFWIIGVPLILIVVYSQIFEMDLRSFFRSPSDLAVLEMEGALARDIQLPVLEPLRERNDPTAALGAIALKKVEDRLQQLGKSLDDNIKQSSSDNKPSEAEQNVDKRYQDIQPDYKQYRGRYDTLSDTVEKVGYDDARKQPIPRGGAPRKIDIIESGDRKIGVSDLRTGYDGRVYGPPINTVEVNKTVTGGARKNVKNYYVEQFNPPVTYKTIVDVAVLSSPSSVSYSIADLPRGADVKVSATMGPWLEIISFKGRKGYIYTQDAVRKE